MIGVILLISDLLYSETTTAIVTAAVVGLFLVVWYLIPLIRRIRET
jgi:hypothetical protein